MKIFSAVILLLSGVVAADVAVQDYQGSDIVLQQPAQRIIGLSPHVVENIYSAGAGHKLVGVMAYSDFPESAVQLPVVGDYSRINYELITALQPDLIIAWNSGRQLEAALKLRDLGFNVYIDDPHSLEDVARSIGDIAVLAGSATSAAEHYLQRLDGLRKKYSTEKNTVSVFYPVWMDPLQTLNGQHIVSDAIRLCGGKNIFSDAPSIAPKVNIESVIAYNPDLIISSGTRDDQRVNQKYWQRWPVLKAVQNKHIYTIPADLISRHTVRLLEGAQILCEKLQQFRSKK